MMPTVDASNNSRKRNIILAIGAIFIVIIVAIVVVFGLYLWKKNTLAIQVKSDLNKISVNMKSEYSKSGSFSVSVLTTDNINSKITGGVSFDGASYCFSGVSVSDKSVAFHIDSAGDGLVKSGTCAVESNVLKPAIPGGVAITFTTPYSINMSWNAATYADSYVMQCSTNNDFNVDLKTSKSTGNIGVCEKLKSKTSYFCRIKAVNKKGDSNWSMVIKASTN